MHRVVITGLGVVAPNAQGIEGFEKALKGGLSGIRFRPELEKLGFSCQIAGKPDTDRETLERCFDALELRPLDPDNAIVYGVLAGLQAWQDAGLDVPPSDGRPDWDSGTIFGNGSSGVEKFRQSVYHIDSGQMRRLGSTAVVQTMVNGVSAFLAGKLGLGNQVSTNASACATGTESVLMCFEKIRKGTAVRMLAGSASDGGPYIWGGFDAMKVCTFKHNDRPERGSRPMSASASGFVPASGAGALLLESLDSARERGATIYAEVLGGNVNSGGQRSGGTMTAPNSEAVRRCIVSALKDAAIGPAEVDVINGHLTATAKDALEIENWAAALGRKGSDFPFVQALKSHIGHCLAASGSIECVAAALQLKNGFLFPNLNCEDLHPDIERWVDPARIPVHEGQHGGNIVAKASFGFGDVNACVIFKRFEL